jgi:hypothetical protein
MATMYQILALNPCRHFTLGIIVENMGMHVWFCDRSGYMVSDLIEYLDAVRLLYDTEISEIDSWLQGAVIDISPRFSAASEENLGHDLSITRVLDYCNIINTIQVDTPSGPRVFRMKRVLTNCSAD